MYIPWEGTRTPSQGCTILSWLLLPASASVWTCPLQLREIHGWMRPTSQKQEIAYSQMPHRALLSFSLFQKHLHRHTQKRPGGPQGETRASSPSLSGSRQRLLFPHFLKSPAVLFDVGNQSCENYIENRNKLSLKGNEDPFWLKDWLVSKTMNEVHEFCNAFFLFRGMAAIQHLSASAKLKHRDSSG